MHRGAPCNPRCYPAEPQGVEEYVADPAIECSPPPHRARCQRPLAAAIHHLKSRGPAQPTVDVPPLPRFHPVPTHPVFEPQVGILGAGN
jgi:hypothetical protein